MTASGAGPRPRRRLARVPTLLQAAWPGMARPLARTAGPGLGIRLPSRVRSPTGSWPLGEGTSAKRSAIARDHVFPRRPHPCDGSQLGGGTFEMGPKSCKSRAPLAYAQARVGHGGVAGLGGTLNRGQRSGRIRPPPPTLLNRVLRGPGAGRPGSGIIPSPECGGGNLGLEVKGHRRTSPPVSPEPVSRRLGTGGPRQP